MLVNISQWSLLRQRRLTLYREEGKHASKTVSSQTVGTGSTGDDISSKRVGSVLHGANKNTQVPPRKRNDGSCRARPRDVLASSPGKPEKTKGQAKATKHGGIKSVLRRHLVRRIVGDLLSIEEDFAGHDCGKSKETADNNGNKDQTGLIGGEMVYRAECVGNTAEEAEKGTKVDGNVEADECNDRLGKQHLDWSNSCDNGECLDALVHGRERRHFDTLLLG